MEIDADRLGRALAALGRADDPQGFATAGTRSLAALFDAPRAVLSLRDADGGESRFIAWPGWCAQTYRRQVLAQDPIRAWLDGCRPGTAPVIRLSDLVPGRALERAPYFETLLRPTGARHVLTLAIRRGGRIAGALSLVRNQDAPDFSIEDRNLATALVPALEMSHALAHRRMPAAAQPFTAREAEIARLVADGATNKMIARQLGLSPETVKNHLRAIFRKAGVANRTTLSAWMLSRAP
ncbi:helix-turn-helix transcriptional regulator [Tistrella mobilis]|uniref:Transcriptional regulator, LuxR family n=1 Tax=Tistrella mobilis (strain KA081020-065) TaxID=1110502 RepID=I3TWM0_TISMK|nr:LuxR C-terminal-related transcriptional regulator [Tistrella mobilis]AFK57158.1 transcriptional regulator, LuxR family [Tistrella mobilis KA081020-065]